MNEKEQQLFILLERINTLMWETYMQNPHEGLKPTECDKIMVVLEEWAEKF